MRAALPCLAALALAACGPQATAVQQPREAGVTASPATAAEPWPADAPAFAAAYPGARVTTVTDTLANGSSGYMVTFDTTDSPTAVVAFYQSRAATAGLPRIAALSTEQSSLFSAGDPATGRALTIQAAVRPADNARTAAALTFALARAIPGRGLDAGARRR